MRDPQWAERWKAAAAELAARKVARREAAAPRSAANAAAPPKAPTPLPAAQAKVPPVSDDWAERWKAAKAELEARKAARRAPAPRRGAPAVVVARADAGLIEGIDPAAGQFERAQLLSMAQRRRPRIPKPVPAEDASPADESAGEGPPAEGEATTAPAEGETSPATGVAPAATDEATGVAPEMPAEPLSPDDELVPLEEYEPFGYNQSPFDRPRRRGAPDLEGGFGGRNRRVPQSDFLPVPDRYRIGLPGDYVQNTRGSLFDPYNQNVLKGDYPILDNPHGDDYFLILTLTSDSLFEQRRLPVPSSVSPDEAGQIEFFEDAGDQFVFNQNFVATVEFFEGDTVYKPRDFEVRATVVGNVNYLHAEQQQVTNIDFREGNDRFDEELAVQELFYEKHLADLSNSYDVLALRAGIQGFNSDFRGFLFSDNLPGIRLFGNYDNNRWQYNLAYFRQVEKDTNSGLNTFDDRDQNIVVANVYRQDFGVPGYTAQLSFHYNNDHSSDELVFDRNGFLVRPAPVGTIGENDVDVVYLGWAGDGHIGRLNLSHQFYQAFGRESDNPIAGGEVDINAQFFAAELSYDVDYIRYRTSFAYASGDGDPDDGDATGFDSIFDNPNFAGGGINYFIRQPVRLTGSGVGLKQRLSLYNNLRTSKEQGQANFVNPGLLLFNVGADVEVTPKLKVIANASYLRFVNSSSMELVLQDNQIDEEIGYDLSLGAVYRPFLNNNVILNAGAAALFPGQGFEDLYTNEALYSTFLGITLTY